MGFKIIKPLNVVIKPVIIEPKLTIMDNQLQAKFQLYQDFKGELSSTTGIQSKGMFIAKIDELSDNISMSNITFLDTNYIHIDKTKFRQAIGVYGKTWMKSTQCICNNED